MATTQCQHVFCGPCLDKVRAFHLFLIIRGVLLAQVVSARQDVCHVSVSVLPAFAERSMETIQSSTARRLGNVVEHPPPLCAPLGGMCLDGQLRRLGTSRHKGLHVSSGHVWPVHGNCSVSCIRTTCRRRMPTTPGRVSQVQGSRARSGHE